MFNLDDSIAQWRQGMLMAGVKSPVPLEELESHLRDDIAAQMQGGGVDAQQAFDAAIQRFGQASALQEEFDKAGAVKAKRDLKLMGAILVGTACFYTLFAGVLPLFKMGSFAEFNFPQQLSASAAAILTGLLLVSGHFAHRFFPLVSRKRARLAIFGAGLFLLFCWLGVFYQLVMTRFELDLGELLVALLWALTPWGALMGIIYGLEHAALSRATAVRPGTDRPLAD